jgi:ribose transport system substrate-binding protein
VGAGDVQRRGAAHRSDLRALRRARAGGLTHRWQKEEEESPGPKLEAHDEKEEADMRKELSGRWGALLAAAVVAALAGAPPARADGLAEAKAEVAKAMQKPEFVAPGEPFDISKLKGKHIWIITSTMAVPFVATIAHGVEAAAKVAGMETTLFDGKGDVSQWNRGMAQAVAQHAGGIVTVTADKTAALVPGTFSHVSISFYHSGQLQADEAIAKTEGKAKVLIFGDNEFPGEVSRVEGMQKEFSTRCPDCVVTVQDTQVGNLGVKLGQLAQTLLRRSPDINMVLPTYDAQAIYIVPAIKSANFDRTIEVIGADAVPSNLDWIRQGNIQIADVGEPETWLGWAALDEVARGMLGMKPVDEQIPLRLFTSENLKGVSNDENELFGGDYEAQYKKLWGIK